MSKVSIYLNFQGQTEKAFNFYKSVFNTEFTSPFLFMKDMPAEEGMPLPSEKEKNMVAHVALPIPGGIQIMGTDFMESMGHKIVVGNNTTLHLELDSKEETDRIYNALSMGSSQGAPMQDMNWGAYWGTFLDQFGIRWMFSFTKG